ncbi:dynamin family protein [Alkalihalobacillus sp. FSL R5-0424]
MQTYEIQWTNAEQKRFNVITDKQTNKRFQMAFCGHFSAGKSTLLNEFIGSKVLPTSPIPTSANIISIQYGDLGVVVKSRENQEQKWEGHIPWEKVAEWGRDGVAIEEVAIHAPLSFLENDAAVFDTPGVDSTDPTHQSITMEALYSMDMIVYVMDYNHVQSETNLYFLKQLSQEKKPLYIVINQVDKHDDSELSFHTFQTSVKTVFDQWNIQTSRIFYTTMKKRNHPLNQFTELERELKSILYQGRQLAEHSVTRLKQGFYLSQAARAREEGEAETEEVLSDMQERGFKQSDLERQEELLQQKAWLQSAKKNFIEEFEAGWEPLFKQVTIFPATTTDLVREWLESMESSFKMGLLFSKKKTEQEREQRLDALIQETQDKVNSQLIFHLQQLFEGLDRSRLTNKETIDESIQSFSYHITPEFFLPHVKAGTKNREYVYTFTRERTAAIVREVREKARQLIEQMADEQHNYWQHELKEVEKELSRLEQVEEFARKVHSIKAETTLLIKQCEQEAAQFDDSGLLERKIDEAKNKGVPDQSEAPIVWTEVNEGAEWLDTSEEVAVELNVSSSSYDASWLEQVKATFMAYQDTKALQFERDQLRLRIERAQKQSFVISLFGAFSAGKSSFANALLGESVLPVSPHPTTATVSTVKQSDVNHPNGTATVQVKSREELAEEIRMVASKLDVELTVETITSWVQTDVGQLTSWQKTYAEYLTVLKKSLALTEWTLGEAFSVSHDELGELVADERYACLLHSVTVFHDCEFTKKGLVLVDTPGVNSIHGRHTNVAFNQLRQSDAIFYVTYYNHAFSKSDQLFLEQMGKINESFQTDKLYFIVNAADLASDERELNGVKQHVVVQLQTLGIKEPRLFAVSSKQGLKAKLEQTNIETDFAKFEAYFYQQIVQELQSLSYRLVEDELSRYLKKVEESIQFARSEKTQQAQMKEKLAEDIAQWKQEIDDSSVQSIQNKIKQEVMQLFLYLRDRVGYRLRDEFSEHINVATIRGRNRKEKRQVLKQMIAEWTQEATYFLEQETSATHMRLNVAMSKAASTWLKEWEVQLQKKRPSFYVGDSLNEFDPSFQKPEFTLYVHPDQYVTIYTTDKAFFEGQQIRVLKEQLVKEASASASTLLLTEEERTTEQLGISLAEEEQNIKALLKEALNRELSQLDALTNEKEIVALETEYQEIQTKQPVH